MPEISSSTRRAFDEDPDIAGLVLIAKLLDCLWDVRARRESFDSAYVRILVLYARSHMDKQRWQWLRVEEPTTFRLVMMLKLIFGWIYARRPLTYKIAEESLRLPRPLFERALLLWWSGKQGRPVTLRHAAVKALLRREYVKETWEETTKRLCPCGKSHTHIDRHIVQAECQPKLEANVRSLKRLLQDCGIQLPKVVQIHTDAELRMVIIPNGSGSGGSVVVSPAKTGSKSALMKIAKLLKKAGLLPSGRSK